jgi:plasmid maintenance system antidote protein VapI
MSNSHNQPIAPSAMLGALIDSTGLSRTEFAARMGIACGMLHKLLRGERKITPIYARAIERAWPRPDNLAGQWVAAQAAYDLYRHDQMACPLAAESEVAK